MNDQLTFLLWLLNLTGYDGQIGTSAKWKVCGCVEDELVGKRHPSKLLPWKSNVWVTGVERVLVQETTPNARRLGCWLENWLLPSSGFCHTGFLPTGLLPRGLEPIRASALRARPGEVRMQA